MDVRVFSRLSLESGVLFHRMGQQLNSGAFLFPENAVTLASSRESGRALEIPFLVKYHLQKERRAWRPFLAAGPAARRTSLDGRYLYTVVSGAPLGGFPAQPSLDTQRVNWSVDPVAGAGIDFKTGRLHLEPEVRYSYWGAGANSAVRKNQVSFLLGLRF